MDGEWSAEMSEQWRKNEEGKMSFVARLRRKVWEAWMYTELEIEKSPEEVREMVSPATLSFNHVG